MVLGREALSNPSGAQAFKFDRQGMYSNTATIRTIFRMPRVVDSRGRAGPTGLQPRAGRGPWRARHWNRQTRPPARGGRLAHPSGCANTGPAQQTFWAATFSCIHCPGLVAVYKLACKWATRDSQRCAPAFSSAPASHSAATARGCRDPGEDRGSSPCVGRMRPLAT